MTAEEKAIDKIRKLLRLAKDNTNENESAAALATAQRLMFQHDIDNVEEVAEQPAVWGEWMTAVDFKDKWERVLLSAVATLYNCRVIFRSRSGHVRFAGKAENVEACEVTLVWVRDQVNSLYKQALVAFKQKTGGYTKQEYMNFYFSFKEACALRIAQRAKEIIAAARREIPAHKALVVIDQSLAAADDLLVAEKIKKGRSVAISRGFGTGAGMKAGDHVKLNREVKS
jgi:hypothetical protein